MSPPMVMFTLSPFPWIPANRADRTRGGPGVAVGKRSTMTRLGSVVVVKVAMVGSLKLQSMGEFCGALTTVATKTCSSPPGRIVTGLGEIANDGTVGVVKLPVSVAEVKPGASAVIR